MSARHARVPHSVIRFAAQSARERRNVQRAAMPRAIVRRAEPRAVVPEPPTETPSPPAARRAANIGFVLGLLFCAACWVSVIVAFHWLHLLSA